ncbi:GDSL-type esterase/lipase family protein [Microbacterium sp. ZW T5_56]|uniref:GDSL-type esterase/lipase family protein n=1 Tax=Microbacterium sp. ZW T5_56 TaxID=3378081 RepID=UPI003854675B
MTGTSHGSIVAFSGGEVRIEGQLALEENAGALRPTRIPSRFWSHFPPEDQILRAMISSASGVRLQLQTDATQLELDVRCTAIEIGGVQRPGTAFVARVKDRAEVTLEAPVDHVRQIASPGEATTREIRDHSMIELGPLPAGPKTVTIFLPQGMIIDLLDVRASGGVRAPTPSTSPVWVHYGSSISHCAEAELPTSVWPVRAADLAGADVINLGFGGQCMLDPFVADAIAQTPADVISVKVGVNIVGARAMDRRTFVPALHGFLDRVRVGHPDTPIVLCSAILWPGSEVVPGPADVEFFDDGGLRCFTRGDTADIPLGALTLADSRAQVAHVVEVRRAAGENIVYLDGTELFGTNDLATYRMPDSLHPDTELYEEIGRRFAALVFASEGLSPLPARTS